MIDTELSIGDNGDELLSPQPVVAVERMVLPAIERVLDGTVANIENRRADHANVIRLPVLHFLGFAELRVRHEASVRARHGPVDLYALHKMATANESRHDGAVLHADGRLRCVRRSHRVVLERMSHDFQKAAPRPVLRESAERHAIQLHWLNVGTHSLDRRQTSPGRVERVSGKATHVQKLGPKLRIQQLLPLK